MATYQITGEWTGPRNPAGDWHRNVHCEYMRVTSKRDREFIEKVNNLGRIIFTDGTALIVRAKDVTGVHHSKRDPSRNMYSSLIRDCVRHGVNAVADLPR